MTIELITKGGGGGGAAILAPDLTFPSSLSANDGYKTVIINPQGSLTTALSLTGRFIISALRFEGLTSENITVKLTVDGIVIWNDTFALGGTSLKLLGYTGEDSTAKKEVPQDIVCQNSLLLELETATDNSVSLLYLARPIL